MWITDQRSKRQLVTFLVDNVKIFFSSNQMRPLRCRPHFTGQVTQARRGDRHLLTQISINSSTSRCPTKASLVLHFHLWCQTGAQVIACAWLNGSLLWLSRARLSSEPQLQVPHTSALPHLCSTSAPLADDLQCPNHSSPRLPVVRSPSLPCPHHTCCLLWPQEPFIYFSIWPKLSHSSITHPLYMSSPADLGRSSSDSRRPMCWDLGAPVLCGLHEGRDFCFFYSSVPSA